MPVLIVQKAPVGRHFGDCFALVLCDGSALTSCTSSAQLCCQHRDAKTIGDGRINHDTMQDHWRRV